MSKSIDFSKYAIIIHHCDNDGYLSGTLLRLYANSQGVHDDNIRYFKYTYNNLDELNQFIDDMISHGVLNEDTYVLMGDISISAASAPSFKRLFNIVKDDDHKWWFDHHRSSIEINNSDEELKAINGIRSTEYCGARLIYENLHESLNEGLQSRNLFDGIVETPVFLVDDHDRFVHEIEDSRAFLAGSMLYEDSTNPASNFWIECLHDDGIDFIRDVISDGETVMQYKKMDEAASISALGFERDFILKSKTKQTKHLKVYCVNRAYNSDIFGELYEKYPLVCCFTYNGRNWKYTFYSSKKDACCDKIAQAYSIGGGGHAGAAGFTRCENIFNKLCVTTPPIRADLSEFFKDYPVVE